MTLPGLFKKYKSFIAYAFFGVCTTLVNLLCYRLFYFVIGVLNVPSAVFAWLFAVLFAFVTNKLWVFESRSWVVGIVIPELIKFFACRIATGILDVAVMWFAVDKMQWNAMIWKFVSNVIVIVLNYFLSKLVIFVKKTEKSENRGEN